MKTENANGDFKARLEDMCSLAQKRMRPVYSAFLNDREQYEAEKILSGRSGIDILLWGGNDVCARKMLRVCDNGSFSDYDKSDFPILPLELSFRKADKPSHRDFLGAFMALGIKRETVGDIFIGDGVAAVFCTKTAHDMISDGVTSVGRIGVSVFDGLSAAAVSCIRAPEMRDVTVTVASCRADCIVGGLTGLSRDKAADLIRTGGLMLNYGECDSISRNVSEGDVITLRGYGKFIVSGSPETTKKGRTRLGLKKYI